MYSIADISSLSPSELGAGQLQLPRHFEGLFFDPLQGFLRRPGKGLRSALSEAVSVLLKLEQEQELLNCIRRVVEWIHAGSLIVDDVQDQSPMRRGEPALHRVVGEARAVNMGTWLYFAALNEIRVCAQRFRLAPEIELALHRCVHQALYEGHLGQGIDLSVRVWDVSKDKVWSYSKSCIEMKTGSITGLSMQLTAIALGAEDRVSAALKGFAIAYGEVLQWMDDLGSLQRALDDPKGWEDFKNGRPGAFWALAARDLNDSTYAALMDLAQDRGERVSDFEKHERIRNLGLCERGIQEAKRYLENATEKLAKDLGCYGAATEAEVRTAVEKMNRRVLEAYVSV